jgi:hypothetical protein
MYLFIGRTDREAGVILRRNLRSFVAALVLLAPSMALAAGNSANLFGEVIDASSGQPLSDAIIVVTSPSMQGEQTAISDEKGRYRVDALPPGTYTVSVTAPTFKQFEVSNITLLVGREVRVKVDMLPEVLTGEEIVVQRQVQSVIDQGSTTVGLTMTKDYMERVAVGRTFNAIVEAAPGAQGDTYGTSFGGSTSPENGVFIDGVNVTDPAYGASDPALSVEGPSLPLEFLDQVEVKTGGYMPEFGNATGGIVNVITKLGGNEFHGSVFNYTTPVRLSATPISRAGEAISTARSRDFRQEMGFEIGGPIVKDFLWFHVGFAPVFVKDTIVRRFNRQKIGPDGGPVTDPTLLTPQVDVLPKYDRNYPLNTAIYRFTSKLTLNINEDHRISVNFFGNPSTDEGVQNTVRGTDSSFLGKIAGGGLNGGATYDGKLLDKKLLVNAVFGYQRQDNSTQPQDRFGAVPQVQDTRERSLGDLEPNVVECNETFADGSTRCPVIGYRTGGYGFQQKRTAQRFNGRVNLTGLFDLLGSHQAKAGFEINYTTLLNRRSYSGGAAVQIIDDPVTGLRYNDFRRYGFPNPGAEINPANGRLIDPTQVTYLDGGLLNNTAYTNWAGYLQDSWSPFDGLNVNGGVRFDMQNLNGGSIVKPGEIGQQAISVANVSPRVGVIYDFTGTGRSKIWGSWGRFFQLVPLDLMDRQFPTERQVFARREFCDDPNPLNCRVTRSIPTAASATPVMKDIQAPYVDQLTFGGEYQILDDLLAGITFTSARYGTAIEDVSPDDGNKYLLGNPGSGDFQFGDGTNPLTGQAEKIKFPKPDRRYDSLAFYLQKSFSRNFMGNISYTFSSLRGNYPGLFNDSTGQLDPNILSDFDLVSLLPNRFGSLPGDRPHSFKIDGMYMFEVFANFYVSPNASFRLASGKPYSYLGAHPLYGSGEAFLLQRGNAGRMDMLFTTDVGVNVEYAFSKTTRLSVGMTIFNLFNQQLVTNVDENYTQDSSNLRPVIGGDASDLKHLKDIGQAVVNLNPNFGNAEARAIPLEIRFNARLSF